VGRVVHANNVMCCVTLYKLRFRPATGRNTPKGRFLSNATFFGVAAHRYQDYC
jgi:hypothetical protein